MITVGGLHVEIGNRVLLDAASFTVAAGERAGLTGRNGAGKSTLLSIVTGDAVDSLKVSGSHAITGSAAFLPQTPSHKGLGREPTVRSHLLSIRGLDKLAAVVEATQDEMDRDPTTDAIQRFVDAQEAYGAAGGYTSDATLERLLTGLGLRPKHHLDADIRHISPGERRRVELCRVLFAEARTLILDEPTNHLDVDSKRWLMHFLSSYDGALLIVSHDLVLLDHGITKVLHLERTQITEYRGTYTKYLRERDRDAHRRERAASNEERQIGRMSQLADSMRHSSAKRARLAKSLDKRIERLDSSRTTRVEVDKTRNYTLPPPPRAPRTLMEVEGVGHSYGERRLYNNISFTLERGNRLVVIGLNGAGKSTLLRILHGDIVPSEGTITTNSGVRIGLYEQEHGNLDLGAQVIGNVHGEGAPNQETRRKLLGTFGLSGDIAFQKTGTLSGGERAKVSLAQLTAGSNNLLLLDEPTNNLDVSSRKAVATALDSWTGTLIVVSHDVDFVLSLHPTHSLIIPDGVVDIWRDTTIELVELA